MTGSGTDSDEAIAPLQSSSIRWPDLLAALAARRDLSSEQTVWAMNQVMAGEVAPEHLGALLIGLRVKGETVAEVAGLVAAILEHAVRLDLPGPAVDVVGTGGDQHNTVNLSTMAAIVVAGTGRRVIKHGNRAASSAAGTADVLQALGVRIDPPIERVAALADEVGITLCFAPAFHPSMRHAGPVRRSLGVPTVFNILGPLANPAQPPAMALGVFDAALAPVVAGVLARRGVSALVFRGDDGLDELSTSSPSQVWVVGAGQVHRMRLDARDLGLEQVPLSALVGADPEHNAGVVRSVLSGDQGPVRDAVLLNAAAGIVAYDGLHDLMQGEAESSPASSEALPQAAMPVGVIEASPQLQAEIRERLASALDLARTSIDSGAAAERLRRWAQASHSEG